MSEAQKLIAKLAAKFVEARILSGRGGEASLCTQMAKTIVEESQQ